MVDIAERPTQTQIVERRSGAVSLVINGENTAECIRQKALAVAAVDLAEQWALAIETEADWPFDTRKRDRYGILATCNPEVTALSASGTVIEPGGRITIPAGTGNRLYAQLSDQQDFSEGQDVLPFFSVVSGTVGTPSLIVAGGGSTTNLTEEHTDKWAAEYTLPAAFTTVNVSIYNGDDSNPLVIDYGHGVAEEGALGLLPNLERVGFEALLENGLSPGNGNLWPTSEKLSHNFTAGGVSSDLRNFGTAIASGEEFYIVGRSLDNAGDPTVIRNVIATLYGVGAITSSAKPAVPVYGEPGVYAAKCKASAASSLTDKLYLKIDARDRNYTAVDGRFSDIQVYRTMPNYEPAPAGRVWQDDHLFIEGDGDVLNIYKPAFIGTGNRYIQFQYVEYDETATTGGGIGNVWEETNICIRTGDTTFAPIYRMHDGLAEFAVKDENWSDQHSGGNEHLYEARTGTPTLTVDGVSVTPGTAIRRPCNTVVRVDTTNVSEHGNLANVVAARTCTKTITASASSAPSFTVVNTITFNQTLDLQTCYMGMLPFARDYDEFNGVGTHDLFDTMLLPNQGNAVYPEGTSTNATYPDESHFKLYTTGGEVYDWECTDADGMPDFGSWALIRNNEVKIYYSAVGMHDAIGLDTNAVQVTNGQSFTMTTVLKVYQDDR